MILGAKTLATRPISLTKGERIAELPRILARWDPLLVDDHGQPAYSGRQVCTSLTGPVQTREMAPN